MFSGTEIVLTSMFPYFAYPSQQQLTLLSKLHTLILFLPAMMLFVTNVAMECVHWRSDCVYSRVESPPVDWRNVYHQTLSKGLSIPDANQMV